MDAITVEMPKSKQDAQQLEMMRKMVRDALDQQVKQAKRKAKVKSTEP
jgi:hypothetical protein